MPSFFRREPVLCIAALAGALSMLAVPPSAAYLSYVDLRVLCLLFCLLTVFRVLPYGILTPVVLAAVFFTERSVLKRVDYGLLLTFVCFFVFAGNIGRIGAVRGLLAGVMERSTLLSSVLASQVISNVPAAVLLSGFTEDWRGC